MRIIAGKYRGRKLRTPDIGRNNLVRPTSDRVREAIFNMLQFEIEEKIACDLFAGTGAMGIEAISRGCDSCTFVEANRNVSKRIFENLKALNIPESCYDIVTTPVNKFLSSAAKMYDLIFIDPPYGKTPAKSIIKDIISHKIIHPDGKMVFEHRSDHKITLSELKEVEIYKEKVYGSTQISIFRMKEL